MKKCPTCETTMNEFLKLDVLIDVCPKCLGIWLDKGELDKIIAREKSLDEENDESYQKGKPKTDHSGDKYRKNKSKTGKYYCRKGGFKNIIDELFE